MSTPGVVHELGIGAAAEDLRIPVGELAVHLAEGSDLSGADESEVLWPEEVNLPLAFVILVGDGLEGALDIAADGCSQRIRGKFFSYSDHFYCLLKNEFVFSAKFSFYCRGSARKSTCSPSSPNLTLALFGPRPNTSVTLGCFTNFSMASAVSFM